MIRTPIAASAFQRRNGGLPKDRRSFRVRCRWIRGEDIDRGASDHEPLLPISSAVLRNWRRISFARSPRNSAIK